MFKTNLVTRHFPFTMYLHAFDKIRLRAKRSNVLYLRGNQKRKNSFTMKGKALLTKVCPLIHFFIIQKMATGYSLTMNGSLPPPFLRIEENENKGVLCVDIFIVYNSSRQAIKLSVHFTKEKKCCIFFSDEWLKHNKELLMDMKLSTISFLIR